MEIVLIILGGVLLLLSAIIAVFARSREEVLLVLLGMTAGVLYILIGISTLAFKPEEVDHKNEMVTYNQASQDLFCVRITSQDQYKEVLNIFKAFGILPINKYETCDYLLYINGMLTACNGVIEGSDVVKQDRLVNRLIEIREE